MANYQGAPAVVKATAGSTAKLPHYEKVLDVSGQTIYGVSDNAIAVVSYKKALQTYVMDVVDRQSGFVSSWPVAVNPVADVSGPFQNVVLTREFAYFPSVRRGQEGINALGSRFELNELSLADGKMRTFALPRNCLAPRVVLNGKTLVVYSWNGLGVWTFNSARGALHSMVFRGDVADIVEHESDEQELGSLKLGAVSDYVFVPGSGAFRLSPFGQLHKILTADLGSAGPHGAARPSADVGPAEKVSRMFAGTLRGRSSIEVIREKNGKWVVSYVAPQTLEITGEASLSDGAVPESARPTLGGSIAYVDRKSGAVNVVSPEGTTTIAQLDAAPELLFARVLFIDEGP
jgi:hypothetical protein